MLYMSIDAWPAESMKRSRLGQSGFLGLCFIKLSQSLKVTGASAIGVPGCPELAFWTASIESVLIQFITRLSTLTSLIPIPNSVIYYEILGLYQNEVCNDKQNKLDNKICSCNYYKNCRNNLQGLNFISL